MRFTQGSRLLIYPHEGLTGCWYVHFPDYEEMTFLERYLRPDDLFYDAGANAGLFAVMAGSFGCPVIAFEPVPHTYQRLVENVELNPELKIDSRNQAIGSEPGRLKMTTGFGTGNHILRDDEVADAVSVEVVTLDSVAESGGVPAFIKADVEGFELEMLRGATRILSSPLLRGFLLETFRPHNWNQPKLKAIESLLVALQHFRIRFGNRISKKESKHAP